MLGNSSLTPVAHLMTYSETGTPRLNERKREAPACARNLTTYLHILKPSCNIAPPSSAVVCFLLAPIFCLIVIHVQSVCLANLLVFTPSLQSCVRLRVTEFILCYLLYDLHCCLILTSTRFSSRRLCFTDRPLLSLLCCQKGLQLKQLKEVTLDGTFAPVAVLFKTLESVPSSPHLAVSN